jgi:hypothetical protein
MSKRYTVPLGLYKMREMVNFLTKISEEHYMDTSNLMTELYLQVKKEMGPIEARELISDLFCVVLSDLEDKKIPFSDQELLKAVESRPLTSWKSS